MNHCVGKDRSTPQRTSEDSHTCDQAHAWDQFYRLHKGSMYRDRHWLWSIFPELFPLPPHYNDEVATNVFVCYCGVTTAFGDTIVCSVSDRGDSFKACRCPACEYNPVYQSAYVYAPGKATRDVEVPFPPRTGSLRVLDIGCGTGSLSFPLLEKNTNVRLLSVDYSQEAISVLKARERYDESVVTGVVCDVTSSTDTFRECIRAAGADTSFSYATLVFVLSALSGRNEISMAITNALSVLAENGVLLIYDYAAGDYREGKLLSKAVSASDSCAQTESQQDRSLGEICLRGEGTRAIFFNLESLADLCSKLGSVEESLVRVKEEHNRKTGEMWTKRYLLIKLRRRASAAPVNVL